MKKFLQFISFIATSAIMASSIPVIAGTIEAYPILEKLQAEGRSLSKVTEDWMKKWRGMDLDSTEYQFKELSGSTSINLKIRKVDPTDAKGYKIARYICPA
jgi:hypothetical protein